MTPAKRRVPDGLLAVFAFPAVMLWQLGKYANAQVSTADKVATFIAMLPGVVIFSVMWGVLWVFALHIIWRLVG